MKRAITILTSVLVVGMAAAQNPSIIQNTKAIMEGVKANETRATNQALGLSSSPAAHPVVSKGAPPAAPVQAAPAKASAAKPAVVKSAAAPKAAPVAPANAKPVAKAVPVVASPAGAKAPAPAAAPAAEPAKPEEAQAGKYSMNFKRDPFISPVVYSTGAANCTSGKKCLEIGNINLKGVVHSDNGFIAVVTNNLNKAYFLRENDPVFDGYVVKITGDSIVFQETMQDRLGKTFTKEVVKKLTTPAV